MSAVWDYLDPGSVGGRAVATLAVLAAGIVGGRLLAAAATRRVDDAFSRYHLGKAVRYASFVAALIGVAIIWRPFAGRVGLVVGLAAAGLAFAMQEVIGAVAGWFNVLSGRIYRIGDRIQVGGVHGDVIDITPLRTKLLEIGSTLDEDSSWVRGRQHTGRIVAVSNKLTFTEPVFNYSAALGYVWEELAVPVSFRSDWHVAEEIVREEAERISDTAGARAAMKTFSRRYPVPAAELAPRVFVHATENWMELAARFVVPVRTARTAKDELTRRIGERFEQAGVELASETLDITVREPDRRTREERPR